MRSGRRQRGDGLSREQQRRLLLIAVGLGGLLLAVVLGLTAASHLYGPGGGFEGPPDAAFAVHAEDGADGLAANVTHAGGQAVDPEQLVVEVDGERRGSWTDLGGDGVGIVAEGHGVVVSDVERGDEVRVLWTGGEEPVELGRNTL